MQRIEGKAINIIVPDRLLSEIDRIAKRQDSTRSEVMRRFLQAGVDIFVDFEKIGVIKLTEIFERTEKTLKRSIGQQKLPELR